MQNLHCSNWPHTCKQNKDEWCYLRVTAPSFLGPLSYVTSFCEALVRINVLADLKRKRRSVSRWRVYLGKDKNTSKRIVYVATNLVFLQCSHFQLWKQGRSVLNGSLLQEKDGRTLKLLYRSQGVDFKQIQSVLALDFCFRVYFIDLSTVHFPSWRG